jgi:hypothetical protein
MVVARREGVKGCGAERAPWIIRRSFAAVTVLD